MRSLITPLLKIIAITSFIFSFASSSQAKKENEVFAGKYKIECRGSETGCPCYAQKSKTSKVVDYVFHLEPLNSATGSDESVKKDETGNTPVTYAAIKTKSGKQCFYDTQKLRPIYWAHKMPG